jgi:hypothetical protein
MYQILNIKGFIILKPSNRTGTTGLRLYYLFNGDLPMQDVQVFNFKGLNDVRTTIIDDKVWFVAKDVAEALGYANTNDAITRHCEGGS